MYCSRYPIILYFIQHFVYHFEDTVWGCHTGHHHHQRTPKCSCIQTAPRLVLYVTQQLGLDSYHVLPSTDDKTVLPLPQEQIISNNFDKFRRPITLPPSTLSDQMLLFASLETEHPKVSLIFAHYHSEVICEGFNEVMVFFVYRYDTVA